MNDLATTRDSLSSLDGVQRYAGYDEDGGLPILERTISAVLNHGNWEMGVIGACMLLGLLATFLATPHYTSTARIEILPDAPVATSVEGERDRAPVNEIAFYNTQYSLLQSRSLADRVVRAGNLTADKAYTSAF